jgi:hypothetical protein
MGAYSFNPEFPVNPSVQQIYFPFMKPHSNRRFARPHAHLWGQNMEFTFQFYIKRISFGILDLLITADIIENIVS